MLHRHRRVARWGSALGFAVLTAALVTPASARAAPVPSVPAVPAAVAKAPGTGAAPQIALPPIIGQLGAGDSTFGLDRGERLVRRGSSAELPSTLLSFDMPMGGTSFPQGGFGTYLVLQGDGNLVEYETTTGKVLFAAGNRQGAAFVYQGDGNAVLYSDTGKVLFQTGTAGDRVGQFLHPYGNGQIVIQSLAGQLVRRFGTPVVPFPGVVAASVTSTSGVYLLTVQSDGNVVLYQRFVGVPTPVIFKTGTQGHGKVRLAVQSDGNLVVYQYPSNAVLWSSHTSTRGLSAYHQLDVTGDGDIQLWRTDGVSRTALTWHSDTARTS